MQYYVKGVKKGTLDLYFWDLGPLHISGTVEDRKFKHFDKSMEIN